MEQKLFRIKVHKTSIGDMANKSEEFAALLADGWVIKQVVSDGREDSCYVYLTILLEKN